MPTITTQIEIAATPEAIRSVFLDFEKFPDWTKEHFRSIEVTSGNKDDIKPGDKLKITLNTMTFEAVVKTNTAQEFRWLGSLPYIFSGEHSFQFRPLADNPGETTFVQEEVFTGLLSFLSGPTWSGGIKTTAGFNAFNRELKARVEAFQGSKLQPFKHAKRATTFAFRALFEIITDEMAMQGQIPCTVFNS